MAYEINKIAEQAMQVVVTGWMFRGAASLVLFAAAVENAIVSNKHIAQNNAREISSSFQDTRCRHAVL